MRDPAQEKSTYSTWIPAPEALRLLGVQGLTQKSGTFAGMTKEDISTVYIQSSAGWSPGELLVMPAAFVFSWFLLY